MALRIRQATESDVDTLSRICLLTADAGKSAELLHDYPELPGLIYAVPYVKLPETWAFVLEDRSIGGVVGYIVGAINTRAYESYAIERWFPTHASRFPSPDTTPNLKPADKTYLERIRNPQSLRACDANVAFSPAHMHINILEEYQGQGWGRKMIQVAAEYLQERGLEGVWLGIDPRNESARRFYHRIGFRVVNGAPDDCQLGLRFSDLQ